MKIYHFVLGWLALAASAAAQMVPVQADTTTGLLGRPTTFFSNATNAAAMYSGMGFPSIAGNDGKVLGLVAGVMTWVTGGGGGGSPGGSNTQIQFNDLSSFGGDAGLTFNKTTDALTVAGAFSAAAISGTTGTFSALTSGRVPIVSTAGLLADDSAFTFDPTTNALTLGTTGTNTISGTFTAAVNDNNYYETYLPVVTSAGSLTDFRVVNIEPTLTGSVAAAGLRGLRIRPVVSTSNTLSLVQGGLVNLVHSGSSTVTTATGHDSNAVLTSTGNITNLFGYVLNTTSVSSSGDITGDITGYTVVAGVSRAAAQTFTGFNVANQTNPAAAGAATNYAYRGQMTSGTGKYNLYMDGTAANYLKGAITTDNQFTSTVSTGTAPFAVSSTTNVANLNASSLGGATFAAPGAIGGTTPAAGTFTTLVAGNTTSLLLGTAGSAVGNIGFRNATSGTATLGPPTGALGTYTVTLPNAASTLPIFGQQVTFTGPTAARSYALPDASVTLLTTNSAVTVAQGGTGVASLTAYAPVFGGTTSTGAVQSGTAGTQGQVLVSNGAGVLPAFEALDLADSDAITGNLPVANLNSGTSASSSTFWRGDGTWATPAGSGTINSGATNTIPKYTASTTLDDSLLSDDGTTLTYTGTGGLSLTGGSVSGGVQMLEGTAPSLVANSFLIYAPTDVAAGGLAYVVPAAGASGVMRAANSSGVMTITHDAGVSNLAASTSADLRGVLSDELGTGAALFSGASAAALSAAVLTSPTITTGIEPTTNDGAALGTTTKQFSDLFLAEGGVINFDNGDATITQTGNDITVAGITTFGVGTSTAVTLGTVELGAASDTTIARVSAGVASIEGSNLFAANTKADVLEAATFAADAGSNDTYVITLSPAITAYVTGAHYWFKANTANTGTATININSVGAITIKKTPGGITTDLADNDIRAGQWVHIVYDGTNMQMLSSLGNAPAGSGDMVAANNLSDVASASTSRTNLGLGTGNSPEFTAVNIGHATDTTVTRAAAGQIAVEGVNIVTTSSTDTLTNKTLTSPTLTTPSAFTTGGTITLAENSSIALDPAGSADGKYTGITVTGTGGTTIAFGDLIYLAAADSRWELTDADAASTSGNVLIGMAVTSSTDGTAVTVLLNGIIRADAAFPTMTISAPQYISATAGDITGTAPSTTGQIVRRVGFALTADELYFNPSMDSGTAP